MPYRESDYFPSALGDDGFPAAPRFFGGADTRLVLLEAGVDLLVYTRRLALVRLLDTLS
jgi:hypothetical protein